MSTDGSDTVMVDWNGAKMMKMMETLGELLLNGEQSGDIELQLADGQLITVHSVVVAHHSEQLVAQHARHGQSIDLRHLDVAAVRLAVAFMYTCQMSVNLDHLQQLLIVATQLHIDTLQTALDSHLRLHIEIFDHRFTNTGYRLLVNGRLWSIPDCAYLDLKGKNCHVCYHSSLDINPTPNTGNSTVTNQQLTAFLKQVPSMEHLSVQFPLDDVADTLLSRLTTTQAQTLKSLTMSDVEEGREDVKLLSALLSIRQLDVFRCSTMYKFFKSARFRVQLINVMQDLSVKHLYLADIESLFEADSADETGALEKAWSVVSKCQTWSVNMQALTFAAVPSCRLPPLSNIRVLDYYPRGHPPFLQLAMVAAMFPSLETVHMALSDRCISEDSSLTQTGRALYGLLRSCLPFKVHVLTEYSSFLPGVCTSTPTAMSAASSVHQQKRQAELMLRTVFFDGVHRSSPSSASVHLPRGHRLLLSLNYPQDWHLTGSVFPID